MLFGVDTEQTDSACRLLADLQVFTGVLAVREPLGLGGRAEVHGLTKVGEAERPCYPHVRQRQVVHVHERSQSWHTRWETQRAVMGFYIGYGNTANNCTLFCSFGQRLKHNITGRGWK